MLQLRWSPLAERDIDRIEHWLDQIDPALADAAVGAILDRLRTVQMQPGIGTPLVGNRRKIIERRFGYLIMYKQHADAIVILRIRQQREDWG
jgi:plasmid stabilization system protein ParE